MSESTPSPTETALWWTISGWSHGAPPAAFIQAWDGADHNGWDDAYQDAGYELIRRWPEYSMLDLEIWRHRPTEHLLIYFLGQERFFVSGENTAAFWCDKFPDLGKYDLFERQVMAAEQLGRAMLGFVRHGHGKHVIDEDGAQTMEERQRLQDQWRREKERKAAAATRGTAAPRCV